VAGAGFKEIHGRVWRCRFVFQGELRHKANRKLGGARFAASGIEQGPAAFLAEVPAPSLDVPVLTDVHRRVEEVDPGGPAIRRRFCQTPAFSYLPADRLHPGHAAPPQRPARQYQRKRANFPGPG